MANVRPLRSSPKRATIFSASTRFCVALTDDTAFRICSACPCSSAVRISASTSFGKHEPP